MDSNPMNLPRTIALKGASFVPDLGLHVLVPVCGVLYSPTGLLRQILLA